MGGEVGQDRLKAATQAILRYGAAVGEGVMRQLCVARRWGSWVPSLRVGRYLVGWVLCWRANISAWSAA